APATGHHVWAKASRALRTPSLADLAMRVNAVVVPGQGPPLVIGFLGNPDYKAESLVDVEAGYRAEVGSAAYIDVTAFRGQYKKLRTNEPLPPAIEMTSGGPQVFVGGR